MPEMAVVLLIFNKKLGGRKSMKLKEWGAMTSDWIAKRCRHSATRAHNEVIQSFPFDLVEHNVNFFEASSPETTMYTVVRQPILCDN